MLVVCGDYIVHISFLLLVGFVHHVWDVFWLISGASRIHKSEIECTLLCPIMDNICGGAFQGSVLYCVVGHDWDIFTMLPRGLVCIYFNLRDRFKFLVVSWYYSNCLCRFHGCLIYFNSCFFHNLFQYSGSESSSSVHQDADRDVCVCCEYRNQTV